MSVSQQRVGPISPSADGTIVPNRASRDGATATQDAHGRYQEAAYRGNVFMATGSAAITINTTATYTGLCITNPVNSGKNIAILEAYAFPSANPTGLAAGIISGGYALAFTRGVPIAQTVTYTPSLSGSTNALLGAGINSVATIASSATLATIPQVIRPLFMWTSGSNIMNVGGNIKDDIGGAILVTPGNAVQIVSIITAINGICALTWEEVSI